jgi:alkylation response protein AidB-like acyl-CoA dehydrogenase
VPRDGDAPEIRLHLVPSSEIRIEQTWNTIGMRGTGSNTVITEDVFVPEHRTLTWDALREGGSPSNEGSIEPYLPLAAYAPVGFVAPMIGAVQGAIAWFTEWTRARTAGNGTHVRDFSSVRIRLGRAAATIYAADVTVRAALARAKAPEGLSLADRAQTMRDCAWVAEQCVQTIDTLIEMSGTAGFSEDNPLQQTWRDVHFAAKHLALNPENVFDHAGRVALGMERPPQQHNY